MILAIFVRGGCGSNHVPEVGNKVLVQEAKKETIKAKVMIEEKKVVRVKEQQAKIKERLKVAKKGLVLEVKALKDDTNQIKKAIDVINEQDSLIIHKERENSLQDTIIDNLKQLDSTNTNIITEVKETAKKEVKQAKKKAFKNGLLVGITTTVVVVVTFLVSVIK